MEMILIGLLGLSSLISASESRKQDARIKVLEEQQMVVPHDHEKMVDVKK